MDISVLVGKTLVEVTSTAYEIVFRTDDGELYKLHHIQDCCESVTIDDINGDLQDLVGSRILMAEEVTNKEFEENFESQFNEDGRTSDGNFGPESCTWTFYKLASMKGYVDVRWFGESNGYYSEGVSFSKADEEGNFPYGW